MILLLFSPQELLPDAALLLALSSIDASGGLFLPAAVPGIVTAGLFPMMPGAFVSAESFPMMPGTFVSAGFFPTVSGVFASAAGFCPTVPDVLSGERPEEAILIPSSVSIALSRFSGMGSAISPVRLPVWRTQSSWSARVAAT